MFVCSKYGQDVPISLADDHDADNFARALQGAFDGKGVASVSFAIAHNVLCVLISMNSGFVKTAY